MDNAERIESALSGIKSRMEKNKNEIITLQNAKKIAEESAAESIKKLQGVREAVENIGIIATLSELKKLLQKIKELVGGSA